jgi:hypothetical protein
MPVENISQLQELWQNIDQIQADQLGEGQLNVKRHIAAAATSERNGCSFKNSRRNREDGTRQDAGRR